MKDNPHNPHPQESTFQEYLDGELSTQEAERFEAHLEICMECTLELAFWQGAFYKIESMPEIELTRNLANEVVPRLQTGADTSSVLYLILAEAAMGTTLGIVLWPVIRTWFIGFSLNLGNSVQIGILQVRLLFSNLFTPLTSQIDWSGLEVESLLGETFWLPTIIAALVLLILGNGIVLKSTQINHQRRK